MIPNCEGCKAEMDIAYEYQQLGYYVATSLDYPSSYNLGSRGHYGTLIVDNKGELILQ